MIPLRKLVRGLGAACLAAAAAALPGTAAFADPAPTVDEMYRALGVDSSVGAAYVVVVDTSSSMESGDAYAQVRSALPRFVRALAPQDRIAVVTFDTSASVLVPLGKPPQSISLPAADGDNTDFGVALEKAVEQLEHADDLKVGGIVLLSDGDLDAPDDKRYCDLDQPGWAALRDRVSALEKSMTVTGYGLDLHAGRQNHTRCGTAQADQGKPAVGVEKVLHAVFPPERVEMQSPGTNALSAVLDQAKSSTRAAKATALLREDAGAVVEATATAGDAPLDLAAAGEVPVTVTLRSTARHVTDVAVTNLAVEVSGLPATVTGLPAETHLRPGQPVTVTGRLAWPQRHTRGFTAGTVDVPGELRVTGTVSSPWTEVVRQRLGYADFALGAIRSTPAAVHGRYAQAADPLRWAMVVLPVLVALAVIAWLLLRRYPRCAASCT
ncbi:vWA domain-containing protein [Dactylosporangium darangshiense]|uniref:vWA domain-containing protein n=1 Tax=Dactylosporangium darangshiense TaxID=579108 RepID=UPI0036359CCD